MLRDLVAGFLLKLEADPEDNGLGIPAILGRPHTGRTEANVPVCAIVFDRDGEMAITNARGLRRLGESTSGIGRTISLNLYLYASGEPELFTLLDRLRVARGELTSIAVGGAVFVVRYLETERLPETEDPIDNFSTVTPVTFTSAEG